MPIGPSADHHKIQASSGTLKEAMLEREIQCLKGTTLELKNEVESLKARGSESEDRLKEATERLTTVETVLLGVLKKQEEMSTGDATLPMAQHNAAAPFLGYDWRFPGDHLVTPGVNASDFQGGYPSNM